MDHDGGGAMNQVLGVDLTPLVVRSVIGELAEPVEPAEVATGEDWPALGGPVLLATKVFAPEVRAELLWRQRLIDRLQTGIERPLTVVCAPPGFGKTTLAVQWARQTDLPVAWLSLGPRDDDPALFLAYLVGAIRSLDPKLVAVTSSYLEAPGQPSPHALLSILLNELAAQPVCVALVLDDVHAVGNPAIHAALAFLLDNLPRQLRLVILTRAEPPLLLARLRARDGLSELRAGDLRFTRDEIGSFFSLLRQRQLTLGDIDVLTERTEGWITGLHLAALSIHGRSREEIGAFIDSFSGSVRLLDEYLMEEVLRSQPADVRSFLLRTSILERFTAELCDVVTGRGGGLETLGRLERANLFLAPLDEHRRWYRYHHLFAEFLRGRLHQQVNETEVLDGHRRAAAWFEAHGFAEEAANHALAGRDWERGLRLVEEIAAQLVADDRLVTLRYWLETLPPEVLQGRPKLSYWLAWALVRTGRVAAAQRPLQAAEKAWSLAGDQDELAAAGNLHAWRCLHRGEARGGVEHARRALALLPAARVDDRAQATVLLAAGLSRLGDLPAAERALSTARGMIESASGNWLSLVEAGESGWVMLRQGRLREATSVLQQVIKHGEGRFPDSAMMAHHGLAEICRERNALDEAERHLTLAEELGRQTQTPRHSPQLSLALARVMWSRGDAEAAFDLFHQAGVGAVALGNATLARQASAYEARCWLDRQELALANRWADEAGLDPYLPPAYARQVELVTYLHLLLARGEREAALLVLNRVQPVAEEFDRRGEVIELHVLRAMAHLGRDELEPAAAAIDQALTWGEPEGVVRTFADHGARIAPLLRHAAVRGPHRDYANRLLAALSDGSIAARPVQPTAGHLLSDREFDVLRLVAAGLSNRDIGARLYISEGTVKKHLGSIFGKLMVVSRTQAVDHARKLELL